MADDDESLLSAWRAGDENAGNRLVTRHLVGVHRFFASKVADHADELTQQTFVACVEARERIRSDARFRPYLYGIARNMLLKHFERRGKSVDAEAASRVSVADLAPSPTGAIANNQRRAIILEALRRIPVDQQIVVELVYWEQMPLRDVAAVVGVPTGTVKSRLSRAREQLAEEITKRIEHGPPVDIEAQTRALADYLPRPGGALGVGRDDAPEPGGAGAEEDD